MSGIMGMLGISDTDRAFVGTSGQAAAYDAITEIVARHNALIDGMLSTFVERTTTDFKIRYKLPGGGRLQRLRTDAPSAAVKRYGSYDVAFPLEGFGAQIAGSRVNMAYMTGIELDTHIDSVLIQNANTVRYEVLDALLSDDQDTFVDPLHGSLSIEPLANGDTVTYPPVLGSESEATEDHYLATSYAATAISDDNDPYATIKDDLAHHFGDNVGGENIVCFINPAERPETVAMSDFDEVEDRFIRSGDNTDVPVNLPSTPGMILGRVSGVWVAQWRWIPSGYMLAVHLDAPKPLYKRVDPADTGLPQGLSLVQTDERYPIESSYWEHRFGFGCANRLNGVAMYVSGDSTWAEPSGYTGA